MVALLRWNVVEEFYRGIYEGHLRKGNFVMTLPNPFPNRKWQFNFATLVYNGICEYSIIQWYFATAFSNAISLLHYSDGPFDHTFERNFPVAFSIPLSWRQYSDGTTGRHFKNAFRWVFPNAFCDVILHWYFHMTFSVKWGNAILKHRFIMAFANNALQQRRFPTVLFRYHFIALLNGIFQRRFHCHLYIAFSMAFPNYFSSKRIFPRQLQMTFSYRIFAMELSKNNIHFQHCMM